MNELKSILPVRDLPIQSVRSIHDRGSQEGSIPLSQAVEKNQNNPLSEGGGLEGPKPADPHPHVSVAVMRRPTGEAVPTFFNPSLSKTGEELYVMWLNHQVTVKGNLVDVYF